MSHLPLNQEASVYKSLTADYNNYILQENS